MKTVETLCPRPGPDCCKKRDRERTGPSLKHLSLISAKQQSTLHVIGSSVAQPPAATLVIHRALLKVLLLQLLAFAAG